MAPFDPSIETVDGLDAAADSVLRYASGQRANCLFCDGSVVMLNESVPTETFRAWCTVSGGEKLPTDGQ